MFKNHLWLLKCAATRNLLRADQFSNVLVVVHSTSKGVFSMKLHFRNFEKNVEIKFYGPRLFELNLKRIEEYPPQRSWVLKKLRLQVVLFKTHSLLQLQSIGSINFDAIFNIWSASSGTAASAYLITFNFTGCIREIWSVTLTKLAINTCHWVSWLVTRVSRALWPLPAGKPIREVANNCKLICT